jgi:flagellar biosynthesis GTPase FlhF
MVRRFEAPTLSEALCRARTEAGPKAVIVEVQRIAKSAGGARVVVFAAPPSGGPSGLDRLLKARGVRPERRQRLLEGLGDLPAESAEAALSARIERLFEVPHERFSGPAAPRRGPRILALVGPTGVGKTTTLAKLAGKARLERKEAVGFVTLDLYRVAAVDQVRAYADLLEAPLEVAGTPAEFRRALGRLAGLDLVLVDTAGRSPLDARRVAELAAFLGAAPEIEVCLVLAATARLREMRDAFARFSRCRVQGLIFTKLDEALVAGDLLELAARAPVPVRFLAAGQEVPDDIEEATPERLAAWVLAPSGGKP